MLQNITITTRAEVSPLELQRTRERLAEFEKRFGLTSAQFEQRFAARELDESLDFIEWLGEIKTLRSLEKQQTSNS